MAVYSTEYRLRIDRMWRDGKSPDEFVTETKCKIVDRKSLEFYMAFRTWAEKKLGVA